MEEPQFGVSVIGLGKLGICSAACIAARGYRVVGVDSNPTVVETVNAGRAPVVEPRLQETITATEGRLTATQDPAQAIAATDVTFLIVPTPSQPDGHFSSAYLRAALTPLAAALRDSAKGYHLFIITSTVSPGTTDAELIPLIAGISGRKLNEGFGVCYSPEFIALGSVIHDFLNPDMLLVGASGEAAAEILEKIYARVCLNRPHVARMSIVSAEIAKISLNAYVTMKISFANVLANLCERIPGAELDRITTALGADRRIGPSYLRGGLAFGGPCFPRDNRAFAAFAAGRNLDALLAKAVDVVNRQQIDHVAARVAALVKESGATQVAILGLAYKPGTPVLEESPALGIIAGLRATTPARVVVFDPLGLDNARAQLGDTVDYATTMAECFVRAPVVVITTLDPLFREIDNSLITHDPTVIIDCWRLLNPAGFDRRVRYLAVGQPGG